MSIPNAQRSALAPEKIAKMAAAATTMLLCMMVCSDAQDTGIGWFSCNVVGGKRRYAVVSAVREQEFTNSQILITP
jgi:hypothetical protein